MALHNDDISALAAELEEFSHRNSETISLDTRCRYICARIDGCSEVNPLKELCMYGLKLYFRPLYDLIKKKKN